MTPNKLHVPTLVELQRLSELCSAQEWQRILTTGGFIDAATVSLEQTEVCMSRELGRRISISQPSIRNSGDETL